MSLYAVAGLSASLLAQPAPPRVLLTDRGPNTSIARPGAPTHIVGLPRTIHTMVMNTGTTKYGLQYVIAHDAKRPGIAIPGEGYIGMPQPSNCNWYAGGFFDLWVNGNSIGSTPIHSFVGRAAGNRGCVDFVFDTAPSLVRIRFVALADSDALFCQVLLEPKAEITSLKTVLRCYPSAFVSNSTRHVLTPTRDLAQGERAELDPLNEQWLLYYDRVFDAGHITPSKTGVGPCSVVLGNDQADNVSLTVGTYGTDTTIELKPSRPDFRFVFFDYKGTTNKAAMADLRQRASGLLEELTTFPFIDQETARWPLEEKQKQIAQVLARMPNEREAAERYRKWAVDVAEQLKIIRSGAHGAVMAEAEAGRIIREWEKGLPELRLKALLDGI